jgi:hypothetical protein
MYENFNDRAKMVMQLATQEAHRLCHDYVGSEHILLGIIKEGNGLAVRVLWDFSAAPGDVRLAVEKAVPPGPDRVTPWQLVRTAGADLVLRLAHVERFTLRDRRVGTQHLLLGLLRDEGVAGRVLGNAGVGLTCATASRHVLELGEWGAAFDDAADWSGRARPVLVPVDMGDAKLPEPDLVYVKGRTSHGPPPADARPDWAAPAALLEAEVLDLGEALIEDTVSPGGHATYGALLRQSGCEFLCEWGEPILVRTNRTGRRKLVEFRPGRDVTPLRVKFIGTTNDRPLFGDATGTWLLLGLRPSSCQDSSRASTWRFRALFVKVPALPDGTRLMGLYARSNMDELLAAVPAK